MTNQAKIVVTAEDRASKVLQELRGQLAATSQSAGELAAAAGLAGPAFATLVSAAGLVGFVKGVADAVDKLNDVADATGATIENLSGLERVARLNGGTIDDVSAIMVKFNKTLAESADPTSSAARMFEALGLSAKDLRAADPAVALQKTAQALAGFADDGSKARFIQDEFGRAIQRAAPFLKDLAEAGALNGKVTTEQAEAAERFNKQLFLLKTNAEDSARALGNKLIPELNSLFARASALSNSGGFFDSIFKQFRADAAGDELKRTVAEIESIQATINRQGASSFLEKRLEGLRQRAADLSRESAGLSQSLKAFADVVDPPQRNAATGNRPSLPDTRGQGKPGPATVPKAEVDQAAEALYRYVQQLGKEGEAVTALTEQQKALNLLRYAGPVGEMPLLRALTLELAAAADARREDAFFAEVARKATEREAQSIQLLDTALDGFSGRAVEATRQAQLARLEARQAAGEAFSDEELQRMVRGIYGATPALEKTLDEAGRSLERFGHTVENTLGDSLEAALRGNFGSIGRMWGDLLLRMTTDALAADLSSALFGNFFKAPGAGVAGGGMGLIGDLLGVIGFGPGRASGGTVNPMSLQPVNERGFEMFTTGGQDWLLAGAGGGKVTPADQVARGLTVVVNNTMNVGGGVSRNEFAAALQVNKAQTVAAVYDAARRGRAVAGA